MASASRGSNASSGPMVKRFRDAPERVRDRGMTIATIHPAAEKGLTPLQGGNDNNAKNLEACIGECDNDGQCKAGLKCFQRNGFTPVPGCSGKGEKSWDYCYDPTGSLELQGGNDNKAKNLEACIGECDNDGQCKSGLKCFQRSHGETIPGCTGKGAGPRDDYCYDPSWQPGTVTPPPAAAVTTPIKLVVESAGFSKGNFAKFTVGGVAQFTNPGRGVNVLVLSPSGTVEETKTFDTHAKSKYARELAKYIGKIPKGK